MPRREQAERVKIGGAGSRHISWTGGLVSVPVGALSSGWSASCGLVATIVSQSYRIGMSSHLDQAWC
jgi:hypothetical protein